MNDQTRCPGCGVARAAVFKGEATAGPPVQLGPQTVPAPAFKVWQCGRCVLLFKDGTLTDRQLAAYYDAVDFAKWDDERIFPPDRAALTLLRRLPRGARVLDFGCSSGRLLRECAANSIVTATSRTPPPPTLTCTQDHVVLALRKPAN